MRKWTVDCREDETKGKKCTGQKQVMKRRRRRREVKGAELDQRKRTTRNLHSWGGENG